MQTLQILDGAETFLRPLDGRSVVLGAASAADVQLRADGVVPRHARIDFEAGTPWIAAVDGPVRLNGRAVARAALELGDRVELGAAVLVVGRSVARSASADDVLANSVLANGVLANGVQASGPRRDGRRRTPTAPRRSAMPFLITGLLVAGLGAFALLSSGGGAELPGGFAELDRLRRAGSFELAQAQVDRLTAEWATTDERRARLQLEVDRLQRTSSLVRERRAAIAQQAVERSYAQISDDLQRDERAAADEEVRLAARIVRASLSELLRNLPSHLPPALANAPAGQTADAAAAGRAPISQPLVNAPPPNAPLPSGSVPAQPEAAPRSSPQTVTPQPVTTRQQPIPQQPTQPATSQPVAQEPSPATPTDHAAASVSSDDIAAVMADTTRCVAAGDYRRAAEQLQIALAGAAPAAAGELQARAQELRAAARIAADQLIDKARREAAEGRGDAMLAELRAAVVRFPAGAEFAGLPAMVDLLERSQRSSGSSVAGAPGAQPGGVDESTRRATLVSVAPVLDRIATAEDTGDFAAAATELRPAIESIRARDPEYAARLQLRLDELDSLAALHRAFGAFLERGTRIDLPLRSGRSAQLLSVVGCHLLAHTEDGDREITWNELAAAGVVKIAAEARLDVEAQFGAAALLYRAEANKEAEAVLAQLLKADAAHKERIDRALARGRGEALDPRGYKLQRDGFVSVAVLEAEKTAGKVLARLDAAVRAKDDAARDAFVTEALALGPAALAPVVAALQRALAKEMDQLEKSALKKQIDRVALQRTHLDQARAFAKELIYDEVKYFYPYNPPQVSSDRYAEYVRVQAEVDRRVADVRGLWDDDRVRVKVPTVLAEGLLRIDRVTAMLAQFGEMDPLALLAVDWARALPAGDTITVQNYCASVAEREQFDLWARIDQLNERLGKQLEAHEREQLQVTNAYRRMFGHRPVAVDLKLRAAARGHAEEMSRLGYFSHFSPTPGRKTPFERMSLAGYTNGVSENIALNDSAPGAHNAWIHSSGHHRNLLMPTHTELGTSGVGRYWVQNFGHGTGYQEQLGPR